MRLYCAITDRSLMGPDPVALVALLAQRHGPQLLLQLREKDLSARDQLELSRRLLQVLRPHGSRLLISDRVDVARCLGEDVGVHLPERGLSVRQARAVIGGQGLIGVSCHDRAGVARAVQAQADLISLSPIWASPQKGAPLGSQALGDAAQLTRPAGVKLLALGGVDRAREAEALGQGADGIAAIRSAWSEWLQ